MSSSTTKPMEPGSLTGSCARSQTAWLGHSLHGFISFLVHRRGWVDVTAVSLSSDAFLTPAQPESAISDLSEHE